MFLSKAFPYFLLALVALLSVASASGHGYLQPRQDDDVSRSASESAASTSASASVSRPTSIELPTITSPSSSPSSTPPPSSSSNPPSSSEPPSSTSSQELPRSSDPITSAPQSTKTGVVTVFITTSGSSTYAVSSTVSQSASASATGGAQQGPQGNSSTMSPQTRNIVIGVAVGVGGALILGALLVVFLRLRRKRNAGEDESELMGGGGRYGHEKTGSVDNSPFKSTLDQYHNPAGRVNQSANF